jgi:hypothetical protein
VITSAVVWITTKDNRQFEIPCHRHADAFYIMSQFCSADEIDKTKTQQGFLDHNGQFLNRIEARHHAFACGQVKEPEGLLYSEDLW